MACKRYLNRDNEKSPRVKRLAMRVQPRTHIGRREPNTESCSLPPHMQLGTCVCALAINKVKLNTSTKLGLLWLGLLRAAKERVWWGGLEREELVQSDRDSWDPETYTALPGSLAEIMAIIQELI